MKSLLALLLALPLAAISLPATSQVTDGVEVKCGKQGPQHPVSAGDFIMMTGLTFDEVKDILEDAESAQALGDILHMSFQADYCEECANPERCTTTLAWIFEGDMNYKATRDPLTGLYSIVLILPVDATVVVECSAC